MTKRTPAILAAAMLLLAVGCGSDDGDDAGDTGNGGDTAALQLIQPGTLTMCSDVPYPPFEDFDEGSELGFTGFDVDIVAEIAERLDLELTIRDQSFDGLQSGLALNSNQCDLVASAMTITEDREANLDFSEPYYDSEQSLLVPTGSDIASIDDLDGKKVGVQQGTTGKSYAEENASGAELVTLPSDAEMFQAIKAGQVDALLQDLPVNIEHTKGGDFEVVETYSTDESYGLAVKQGNTSLLEAVDGALAEMRDDGTYDEIYNQYFATN